MEVLITYELNGEQGTTSAIDADYETARDKAFEMVPEGAQRLSIRVDRDV